ncbi:glycosyltransferase family 4 protein [Falsirhodobacter sp. alg1]|uniref:glycosyltransferase family 4 protein n=1 Tax=Falsirhodobacter sp. alg1 TaxID=1472418 RepID=UPI00192D1B05|nr:glycosyltransferase family 4 protein [Falsirhodobacter sp. alg1]
MILHFAYPGDLQLRTGGYGYDRQVIAGLRARGWQVNLVPLGAGFPFPTQETLREAEAALSALPDGATVLVDGLAFGVMADWAQREASRLRLFALVHHPLGLEGGQPEAVAARLLASEGAALAQVRGVVVTSPSTARDVRQTFDLAADDIIVALPGTEPAPRATGAGDVPHILSIGTIIQRKGHDVLIDALTHLTDLDWRASIVGSLDLDPETARDITKQVRASGLADRITLVGQVDDTRKAMAEADIFALASRYEGYGMVFAEALSQGLPIVACHAGAVPDVVPPTAGILVSVNDGQAFAMALRQLLTDRTLRCNLADGAYAAGRKLPSWSGTAAIIAEFLEAR